MLLSMGAAADDWPQWRGPNRDGVWAESGIVESFPLGGLTARWRFPVAWGFSSPVVAQGRVFVSDAELLEPKVLERVHCLEADTGKRLWSYAWEGGHPDWIFMLDQRRGPGATPIVRDGKVFALGTFGDLVCLDAAKGHVLWKKSLRQAYPWTDLPADASPLIEGDLLIVFNSGRQGAIVAAFDKNSGREVWQALDEAATHSSPVVISAGGTRQLIVWTQKSVVSLDPRNGRTHWREPLLTSADHAVATPVCFKDRLLISGLMFRLEADRPAASVLWPLTRAISHRVLSNTCTPLFQGDHLYAARSSGELVCLEAGTGKQVWETNTVTALNNGASINLTPNGKAAFLFTDQGELIRARLAPEGYKEVSRAALIEPTAFFMGKKSAWAAPAFANRHIFVRNDKELICVSLAAIP